MATQLQTVVQTSYAIFSDNYYNNTQRSNDQIIPEGHVGGVDYITNINTG
jgi:hypothetical protein